jgi:hypothetical protein
MPRPVLLAAIGACLLHAIPAVADSQPPVEPVGNYIADTFGAIVIAATTAPNATEAANRLTAILASSFGSMKPPWQILTNGQYRRRR